MHNVKPNLQMSNIFQYCAWANQRHRQCHTARLRGGARYTARHVITVIVLAFLAVGPEGRAMRRCLRDDVDAPMDDIDASMDDVDASMDDVDTSMDDVDTPVDAPTDTGIPLALTCTC